MKTSIWMKLAVMVVCAAMLLSLFACNKTPAETDGTEKPSTTETEAPSETETSAPTETETSAPTETETDVTTESEPIVTTETEAPVTTETETEPAETESATETETESQKETESTTETETETETEASNEVNILVEAEEIAKQASSGTQLGEVKLSADKSYVSIYGNGTSGEAYFTALGGNSAVTGQYAFLVYRYPATNESIAPTAIEVFTSTSNGGAAAGDSVYVKVIADGQWHMIICNLDGTGSKTFNTGSDGKYTAKYARIDILNQKTPTTDCIDVKYFGIADSIANILKYAKDDVEIAQVQLEKDKISDEYYTATGKKVGGDIDEVDNTPEENIFFHINPDVFNDGIKHDGHSQDNYAPELANVQPNREGKIILVGGWFATFYGVKQYMFSVDGGKTLIPITGGSTSCAGPRNDIVKHVQATYPYLSETNWDRNSLFNNLTIDLSGEEYHDKTFTVELWAEFYTEDEDTDDSDNPKVKVLSLYEVYVGCIGDTWVVKGDGTHTETAHCINCGKELNRTVDACESNGIWKHIPGVLKEATSCRFCGKDMNERDVQFVNASDRINGVILGGSGITNVSIPNDAGTANTKSDSPVITVEGWFAVNGGVNKYVYKVNGGDWKDTTGGSVVNKFFNSSTGHQNAINGKNLGWTWEAADHNGKYSNLVIDLTAYQTQTVDVVFGAVLELNQTAAPVELLKVKVVVPCYHTDLKGDWTTTSNPGEIENDCNICGEHIVKKCGHESYTNDEHDPLKAVCNICGLNITKPNAVVKNNNAYFGPLYLANRIAIAEYKEDATGIPYAQFISNKTGGEFRVSIYSNTSSPLAVGGNAGYIAYLYRKPNGAKPDTNDIYMSTNLGWANGNGDSVGRANLVCDGEWHLAIIPTSSLNRVEGAMTCYFDPAVGIGGLDFDVFNINVEAGISKMDIAYFGLFDSAANAYNYCKLVLEEYNIECTHRSNGKTIAHPTEPGKTCETCLICGQYINVKVCDHKVTSEYSNYVATDDILTYTVTCKLCGKSGIPVSNVTNEGMLVYGADMLLANAEKFKGANEACNAADYSEGGAQRYTYERVTDVSNNNLPYMRLVTKTDNAECFYYITSNQRLTNVGQYMSILYRTDVKSNSGNVFGGSNGFDGRAGGASFIGNGTWNLLIYDMSQLPGMTDLSVLTWGRWDFLDDGKHKAGDCMDIAYIAFSSTEANAIAYYTRWVEKYVGADDCDHIRTTNNQNDPLSSVCNICNSTISKPNIVVSSNNAYFGPAYLANRINIAEYKVDVTGIPYAQFTSTQNGGEVRRSVYSNTGSPLVVGGNAEYIAVLYRKPNGAKSDNIEFFMSTNIGGANGSGDGLGGKGVVCDGEWHIAIWDTSNLNRVEGAKTCYFDPAVGIGGFDFDVFNTNVESGISQIDVAYIGVFDTSEDLIKYYEYYCKTYGIKYESRFTLNLDKQNCVTDNNVSILDSNKSGSNAPVVIDCTDVTLNTAKSLKLGGWFVTYGGVESYKFRVVSVDGSAVQDPQLKDYFVGATVETTNGIYTGPGKPYGDESRIGAGFQSPRALDLTGFEGKRVNVEVVAVTNYGPQIVIVKLNNITVPNQ